MKSVIVLAIVFAVTVVADDEWVKKLHDARKHCLSDPATKIDDATLTKLRNQEITDWREVSKYTECVGRQFGFLNADGKIDVENVKKALRAHVDDESKVEEAVKECLVEHESPGKTALLGMNCMRRHMGEKDFFKN